MSDAIGWARFGGPAWSHRTRSEGAGQISADVLAFPLTRRVRLIRACLWQLPRMEPDAAVERLRLAADEEVRTLRRFGVSGDRAESEGRRFAALVLSELERVAASDGGAT